MSAGEEQSFHSKLKWSGLRTAVSNCLGAMGNVLGQLNKINARIVMLGLDAAGKTTILYKLKLKDHLKPSSIVPTIGFNVETINPRRGVSFVVWDAGGQDKIRCLWKHYFRGCDVLLFVLDSADSERYEEAREELWAILENENMKGVPVIVIANKQDLPEALPPAKVVDVLELSRVRDRPWKIHGTCAIEGEGLQEAMDTLVSVTKSLKKQNK